MLQGPNIDVVERKLGQLLDSLVVGCWIRGPRGEPGFWSDQVYQLYGLPVCEVVPSVEVILQQLDTAERARMWRAAERCGAGKHPFAMEYTVRTPQGVTRRLKSSGHLARGRAGETVIVGTVQDVTAIAPLRAEIRALTDSLQRVRRSAELEGLSARQWERVEALMRSCEGGKISVRELAAQVRLRPSEFIRRFRITTGETPHQFLLRLRLERASEALRGKQSSIARIALDFGFFDQAHFTRQFKRQYGLTPARFAATVSEPAATW